MESTSSILSAVDEVEDNLYYFSDVVSAGIPDVGRLIMDNVLRRLIFPIILPSLRVEAVKVYMHIYHTHLCSPSPKLFAIGILLLYFV